MQNKLWILEGDIFTFRPLVKRWTAATENLIYVVLGLYLLTGVIQQPTLRAYIPRKKILSTSEFGDVVSSDRLELMTKFLHFTENKNKAN
jgi:uncharacterized membrane protein